MVESPITLEFFEDTLDDVLHVHHRPYDAIAVTDTSLSFERRIAGHVIVDTKDIAQKGPRVRYKISTQQELVDTAIVADAHTNDTTSPITTTLLRNTLGTPQVGEDRFMLWNTGRHIITLDGIPTPCKVVHTNTTQVLFAGSFVPITTHAQLKAYLRIGTYLGTNNDIAHHSLV